MTFRQQEALRRVVNRKPHFKFRPQLRRTSVQPTLMDVALLMLLITGLVLGFMFPSPLFS